MKNLNDYNESANEMDAIFFIIAVLVGMFFGGILTYLIISNFRLL